MSRAQATLIPGWPRQRPGRCQRRWRGAPPRWSRTCPPSCTRCWRQRRSGTARSCPRPRQRLCRVRAPIHSRAPSTCASWRPAHRPLPCRGTASQLCICAVPRQSVRWGTAQPLQCFGAPLLLVTCGRTQSDAVQGRSAQLDLMGASRGISYLMTRDMTRVDRMIRDMA